MRAPLLFVAALALAACGKNAQTGDNQNVGENLSPESIVSNDVTAIDAVTGDAANMAADVNYVEVDNNLDNEAVTNVASPSKPPLRGTRPAENAAANTPANSTE